MTGGWKWRRPITASAALCVIGSAALVGTAGGSRPATLTGKIRVNSFVVPAGTVRILNGALNLVARGRIEIDGTLEIVGGHNVRLSAGTTLKIGRTGRIMPAPRAAGAPPPQVIKAPHLLELLGSKLVEIDTPIVELPAGDSLKIATADFGTIRLNHGALSTRTGRAGTKQAIDGGNAGSIILGGLFGQNERIQLIDSTIIAGGGGLGFDSEQGTVHGTLNPCIDRGSGDRAVIESRGGNGGNGGTVRLLAKQVVVKRSTVLPGYGGTGGHAYDKAVGRPLPGHGGIDVLAWSGDGGAGGGIFIEGHYTGQPIRAGRAGEAGIVIAAAGNGGPSCDGGRTTVLLGRPGELGASKGEGTEPPRVGPFSRAGDITLANGGNGGPAEDRNHAGGNGGFVGLGIQDRRKNHPLDPPVNFNCCYVSHITVHNYANGGAGFSGCAASPAVNGTDGGTGGRLFAGKFQGSPLRKFPELPDLTLSATDSFNGGPGGDGDPVGDGGAAGTTRYARSNFKHSFNPGARGAPCSGTTGHNTPPSAFISASFFPEGSAGACEDQAPGNVNYGETCYTIHASDSDGDTLSYGWSQIPPVLDPGCSDFHVLAPPLGPGESVWHHGDANGCNHGVEGPDGHEGVVFANVTDGHYTCVAPYPGTNTGEVPFDAPCYPAGRYALTLVKPYQAAASSGNGGTVTSADGTIKCQQSCQLDGHGYAHGAVVKLTATPDGSWTFKGWNGACTGTDTTCTITMNTDQEVTATFGP